MNERILKLIAVVTMTLSHIAHALLPEGSLVYGIFVGAGMIAAPVMCGFAVLGYHRTHSLREYGKRLLLCGVIAQIPYVYAFGYLQMDVLFTLALCLLTLWVKDHMSGWRRILVIAVIVAASALCDWGIVLPLLALVLDRFFAARGWVSSAAENLHGAGGTLHQPHRLPAKRQRMFFYIYYPAHLVILCILKWALGIPFLIRW